MNQSPLNAFSEKLFAFLKKAKEVLSKDYSMQDLKNLKNLKNIQSLPKALQQKLTSAGALSNASSDKQLELKSTTRLDLKKLPEMVREFLIQYRNIFVTLALVLLLLVLNAFLIAPFGQGIQDQLEMRPAQWSQLQSLIKQAKSSSSSASVVSAASSGSSYSGAMTTVTLLDDVELQKIRSVLTARGLKTNVLRLTADNPPRIEFQASDVMFSVLLDTLDELRIMWRLYPEQLNMVSSGGAGVVNISGVLLQFSGQAGVSR